MKLLHLAPLLLANLCQGADQRLRRHSVSGFQRAENPVLRYPPLEGPPVGKRNSQRVFSAPQETAWKGERIELVNDGNQHYLIESWVGEPVQGFLLGLNLRSSETWIPSWRCGSTSCFYHFPYYDWYSDTYKMNQTYFESGDSVGQVFGYVSRDDFRFGEYPGSLNISHQDFGEVLSELSGYPLSYLDPSWDGILGLGFQDIAYKGLKTPFSNWLDQGMIDEPVFSIYLRTLGEVSELTIGGYDDSRYSGKMHHIPLRDKGRWGVNFTSITMRNNTVRLDNAGVVFDTLVDEIRLPLIYGEIINVDIGAKLDPDTAEYLLDCNTVGSLPDITLGIAGHDYKLTSKDYVRVEESRCVSLIRPFYLEIGNETVVSLGSSFLRAYFSVYDYEKGTIGLAKAK